MQAIFSTSTPLARNFSNFRRFLHQNEALLNEKVVRFTPQKAFLILSSRLSDAVISPF